MLWKFTLCPFIPTSLPFIVSEGYNEHNWYLKHLPEWIVWSFPCSWWLDISISSPTQMCLVSHVLSPRYRLPVEWASPLSFKSIENAHIAVSDLKEIASKDYCCFLSFPHFALISCVNATARGKKKKNVFGSWEYLGFSGLTAWTSKASNFSLYALKGCGIQQFLSYLCRKAVCLSFDHHSPVILLINKTGSL